eukprot:1159719-Pelagomonas_calceolata.AAC.7
MASAASHSAPHTPLRTLDTLDSEGSDAEDAGGIGADGSSCLCVGSAWASTCITADKTVVASSADVDATDAACGLELLSEAVVVVVVAGAQALAAEVRVRREGARSASSASRTAKCAACKRAVSASPSPSGTAALVPADAPRLSVVWGSAGGDGMQGQSMQGLEGRAVASLRCESRFQKVGAKARWMQEVGGRARPWRVQQAC